MAGRDAVFLTGICVSSCLSNPKAWHTTPHADRFSTLSWKDSKTPSITRGLALGIKDIDELH